MLASVRTPVIPVTHVHQVALKGHVRPQDGLGLQQIVKVSTLYQSNLRKTGLKIIDSIRYNSRFDESEKRKVRGGFGRRLSI